MRIIKIQLSKKLLRQMPAKERNIFLLLGHIANGNIILQKFLLMSRNPSEVEEEGWAEVTQALLISKVLVAKLFEGWDKVQKLILKDKSSCNSLLKDMDEIGQKALAELKQHFGKSNRFSTVRNKLAFHYDIAEVEKSFGTLAETSEIAILLGKESGNSLYYASEIVMMEALIGIYGGDAQVAVDTFFNDLASCANHFGNFIESCLCVLLGRYFPDIKPQANEIPDPPRMDSVRIPFFVVVGD